VKHGIILKGGKTRARTETPEEEGTGRSMYRSLKKERRKRQAGNQLSNAGEKKNARTNNRAILSPWRIHNGVVAEPLPEVGHHLKRKESKRVLVRKASFCRK